jgi:hypothetical protein
LIAEAAACAAGVGSAFLSTNPKEFGKSVVDRDQVATDLRHAAASARIHHL